MGKRAKDLTERIFGRLHVIERATEENAENHKSWKERKCKKVRWICHCFCDDNHDTPDSYDAWEEPKEVIVKAQCLLDGSTRSCGCLKKEAAKKRGLAD